MKKIYIIAALLLSFSTVAFGATYDVLNFDDLNNGIVGASPNDIFQVRNNITSTSAINNISVAAVSVLGNHYIFNGNGNTGFTVLVGGGLTVNFGNSVDSAIKNFTLSSGTPMGGFAYNAGGLITITNSAFLNNVSSDNSFADRGGLILYQNAGSGAITSASFVNNGVSLTGITSDININGGLFKTDGGTFTFKTNELSGATISLIEDSLTAATTTTTVNGGIFNLANTTSILSGVTVSSTSVVADSVFGGIVNQNGGNLTFNASSAASSITGTTINADIIEGGIINATAGTTSLTSLDINSNAVGTTSTSTVNGGLINDSSSTFGYSNSNANANTVLGKSISGGLISSNASDNTNLSSLTMTSNTIGNASTNTIAGGLIKDTSTNTFTLTGSTIGSSTNATLKNTITAATVDGALINTNAQAVSITNNAIGYNVVNTTDVNALVKIGAGATNSTVSGNTITRNTINASNDLSGGVLSSDSASLAFSGNAVTSNTLISSNGNIKGGLLNSTGTTSIGGNSSFSSNTITATNGNVEGGVLYNGTGINLNISSTTFSGNTITAGTDAKGGAIYNNGGDVTFSSCNLNASTINAGNNAYGGAIYNDNGGTITLNNTNITNNVANGANALGGAIYNDNGTININSTASSVNITGNRANGVSNAIYTNAGNINFNTAANTITLSDKIVSADSTTTMGITGTSGSLVLNADLRDYTGSVTFSGRTLKVNAGAYYFAPLQTDILSSGLYDFKNGIIDNTNLGNYSMAAGTTLSMWIDAALSGTGQIDHFSMPSAIIDPTAQASIESIRLLSDLSDLAVPLTIEYADKNINTVINTGSRAKLIFTPVSRYDLTVDNSAGTDKIVFTSAGIDSGGLKNAIASTDNNGIREFTLTTNETVTDWANGNVLLGNLLFVDGQNKKVTTLNSLPGIELNSANQITINDVSEWSGFNSAKGGAIYNDGGTVVVSNSTFKNNQASRGGAIYQKSGALNFSGTITNNTATGNGPETAQGGGVYVAAGQTPTITGTISSNSAISADAKG